MICPKCGRENDNRVYYCLYCGQTLRKGWTEPDNMENAVLTALKVMGEDAQLIEGKEHRPWYRDRPYKLFTIQVGNRIFNKIVARKFEGWIAVYDLFFLIDAAKASALRRDLYAMPHFKYKGLFNKKTVDVSWSGGALADRLNADPEVKRAMLESHPNSIREGHPEMIHVSQEGYPVIRVTGVRLTYNLYELVDRIARHIQNQIAEKKT